MAVTFLNTQKNQYTANVIALRKLPQAKNSLTEITDSKSRCCTGITKSNKSFKKTFLDTNFTQKLNILKIWCAENLTILDDDDNIN